MKEYSIEDDNLVDLKKLQEDGSFRDKYPEAHRSLIIACHDVFIKYDDGINSGILLLTRENLPVKGVLWPVGGRILRGVPAEESLREKARLECGLELDGIEYLGSARTFFETDPFGHGKGTDTLNLIYYAKGKGKLKPDSLHSKPVLVSARDYTSEFRAGLHPYVRDFLDIIVERGLLPP